MIRFGTPFNRTFGLETFTSFTPPVSGVSAPYQFLSSDILFDANSIDSLYQDAFKSSSVSASGNPVVYITDDLT